MHTSNHSRVYWLTPAGSRLANYLNYVQSRPDVSPDIAFADRSVPEQHDEDRDTEDPETDLQRLHRELEQALDQMRQAGSDDDAFVTAARRVKSLRNQIYTIENGED